MNLNIFLVSLCFVTGLSACDKTKFGGESKGNPGENTKGNKKIGENETNGKNNPAIQETNPPVLPTLIPIPENPKVTATPKPTGGTNTGGNNGVYDGSCNSDPRCEANVKFPTSNPLPPSPTSENKPLPEDIPPGKVLLELRVQQLKYESWWKNCLEITLDGDTKSVGCNKDADSEGRVAYFLAKKSQCNSLNVVVKTYKPTDGNATCLARSRMNPPQPCEGPYGSLTNFDVKRSPANTEDAEFFKIYNHSNIANKSNFIQVDATFNWTILAADFLTQRQGGTNGWTRIFFEDQPQSQINLTKNNPSKWRDYGVDYNDFIFDISGKNVKFEIEGSPLRCSDQ